MTTETVEMRPAFAWDCPRCARENFANGLVPELTADQQAELAAAGIMPHEIAVAAQFPAQVKCRGCGRCFNTTGWNMTEGDVQASPEIDRDPFAPE